MLGAIGLHASSAVELISSSTWITMGSNVESGAARKHSSWADELVAEQFSMLATSVVRMVELFPAVLF